MAKIGRNAPCPCGSGKKFKKCCMMKKQTESLTRSMIHRKTDELIPDVMAYYEENYDKEIIGDAWGEFYGEDGDFDGNPYMDMFFRWFLFYWIPDDSII
ncbi:MAG: SEC-C metal-binding domain-containing protein, partial [Thermotogota bacterium]|nr:SEC-C metal-binding domain-containing protein [Thermotogota bacterium]